MADTAIFDSHMHVGEFPLFNVELDRDGPQALMAEHGITGCVVFHPDNGYASSSAPTFSASSCIRVLYGSDAPFHHPSVEIQKVRVSGLEPETRRGRAGRERALALPPRGRGANRGGPAGVTSIGMTGSRGQRHPKGV